MLLQSYWWRTAADGWLLGMWKNSKPSEYLSFRVFIFGITSQSMFPNGVVYEGINDNKPMFFRGESGANDSMVHASHPHLVLCC